MDLNQFVCDEDGSFLDVNANPLPAGLEARAGSSRLTDLEGLLEIVRKINTSLVVTEVLSCVLDEAIRIARADRGFVMLADDHGQLRFETGRASNGEKLTADRFDVSATILKDVFSTGESYCIEDAMGDDRFDTRKSVLRLELRTVLCAPLVTPERVIGVIYVDSQAIHPEFKEEMMHLFEILAGQAATSIRNARLYEELHLAYRELKEADERLKISLGEKEVMLKEIHHRVKNNLQIISSLLNIQAMQIEDEKARVLVRESQHRIRSMALVHDKLYHTQSPTKIDFDEYLRELTAQFESSFRSHGLRCDVHGGGVFLNLNVAIPAGLIVNEMLSNALKHAFPGRTSGHVEVFTINGPDGKIELKVRDDGVGFPDHANFRHMQSMGMNLIERLVEQLSGTLELECSNGTSFTVVFPPA
jgi:two-component sensor histidine kinase